MTLRVFVTTTQTQTQPDSSAGQCTSEPRTSLAAEHECRRVTQGQPMSEELSGGHGKVPLPAHCHEHANAGDTMVCLGL